MLFPRRSSALPSLPVQAPMGRAADACFRAAFDSAPIGMALVGHDGQFIDSNPRLRALLGYDAEELQQLTLADVAVPDVVARDARRFSELLAGRPGPYEVEGRFRHRNGEEFSGRLTTAPVTAEGDAFALRMIEDVTARQRLEEQLRQAQKMDAIGRLAGGLAHDFNNLLTVIKGYSEGLVEDLVGHQQWQEDADAIREAATRAAALTAQLLAFGRKQQVTREPIDLNVVVTGVQVLLKRLIPSSIDVRIRTAPDIGAVMADATQLEQVLINLAVNARDAMPRGGVLSLQTASVDFEDDTAAAHAGLKAGSYVVLSVSDTGEGMDEATRSRIFEPFFTTKGKGVGTGLGLATVFGIVQQAGGNVWVYSEVGTGTTFKVYLPRVDAPVVTSVPTLRPTAAKGGDETILLVEDQDAVRELLVTTLSRMGYRVLAACDGEEALAVSAAHAGPIAALITDVVMPRLSGPDLHRRLASSRAGIKVVFMSGYAEDHVRPFAVDDGTTFLEKPFSPALLTRTLRALIDCQPVQKRAGH